MLTERGKGFSRHVADKLRPIVTAEKLRYPTRQEQLHVTKLELENLLSDRKVELADPEPVKNYVADLYNLLGESTLVERKSLIRSFVKEVRVTGAEALMTYTIPMPPKQLSQETLVVPPIVHYGGPFGTVPELWFEKKQLIPVLQQLLVSSLRV